MFGKNENILYSIGVEELLLGRMMMRALIVDDDFYSRNMIHEILRPVAHCDIAVNGEEAIEPFGVDWQPMNHMTLSVLICLCRSLMVSRRSGRYGP